jgi:putative ABC transport system permease protein
VHKAERYATWAVYTAMSKLVQDARFALRVFQRAPGFAAAAVLTLAVGIGANTSIFSVANALLLRPLPYRQADRLVLIDGRRKGSTNISQGPLSVPRFEQVELRNRSFGAVAAFTSEGFNLTGRGDPEQIPAARVSWKFFEVLGVSPTKGRGFRAEEDKPGGDLVAMISDGLWQRRFARDTAVIGRAITLDSRDYTIVGVLPADFRFAFLGATVDIVTPRVFELNSLNPGMVQAGVGFLNFIARLNPGASVAGAQGDLDRLSAQYRAENPKMPDSDPGLVVHAGNLRDEMVSSVRTAVLVLFGGVSLVLLIACANVASLLLSRALGRKREIAVRMAMGATRGGLIRQLLTESLMLALGGGVLGAVLSSLGTQALARLAQGTLPRAAEIRVDAGVLLFTLAISVFAGFVFGLMPALQVSRPDLNMVLRSEGRGATSGRRHHALRNLLVVSQVGLSTVLLIGAGLLLRNFVQLSAANPGFDAHRLLTLGITLPPARYPDSSRRVAFFNELLRQVRALPGVRGAAGTTALPVNASRFSMALPDGQPMAPLAERPIFNLQQVTPGYAAAMRVPVRYGREFTDRDDAKAPRVVMVNEALARRYWPKENPVGKHILLGRQPGPSEIVGVLGDVANLAVGTDPQAEIYVPFAQIPSATQNLIVRTAGDPRGLTAAVRARVLGLDRDQPVTGVRSMDEVLETGAAQPRFTTYLLGGLSATAFLLSMVGIYGVIAYSVAERTQEMGIRMALGADGRDILRLVLGRGLVPAGTGIAIGLAAAFALTRLMSSLLYRVSVTDPVTFIAGPALFAAVAVVASYLPARRAMRVDPAIALRAE